MAHWRSVRAARETHDKRVEEEQNTGAARIKAEAEQSAAVMQEVGKLFSDFRAADDSEQDFLKEKEGDDEWNQLLAARRDMVDTTLGSSYADRKLTPEQRKELVRKFATVRGRAIGYSMKNLENQRLQAQIQDLTKQLEEYKNSEPGSGSPTPAPGQSVTPTDPFERVRSEIRARAKTRSY